MADDVSTVKAQVPQNCHMCEETTEIKFRCVECDFLLCERCRRFHEKVRTQEAHQIIDLRKGKQVSRTITRLKSIPCKLHEDENYILFCQDCNEFVCATCVSTLHQKHAMKDMKVMHSEKIKKIEKLRERIDQTILPNLEKKQKRLENLITFHTQKIDKAKQSIYEWEKYLKDSVAQVLETQRKKFVQNLDKNLVEIKNSILPEISKLEDMQKKVKETSEGIDETSKSYDLDKTSEFDTEIQSKLLDVTTHKVTVRTKFSEFERKPIGSMPMLGELKLKHVFQVKTIESFKTELTYVDKIVVIEDDMLLLRNLESKIVNKVKIDSNNITQIDKWKIDVKDMDSLRSGETVLILMDKTEVRISSFQKDDTHTVSDVDTLKKFFDTTPQIPTAIHVSRENNVIISTVEPGRDVIPMDEPCNVQIIVLTAKGELVSCFEFNKDLFCFPNKISSIDEDICIADSISDYSGRVVTLDSSGKVKWIYGDESSSIVISDMVATPLGNLILLQICQGILYVLDSNGVCLNTWSLRDLDISHPYSLTIRNDEHLLIGCGVTGKNLHVLEFIES